MIRILQITFAFVLLLSCISAYRIVQNESWIDENDIEERSKHPDVGLRVPVLVTKYGYPIETYSIETEDGYILTLHRIPHGKNNTGRNEKLVVFLQHGILCSSADWVLMGPEKGLGYLLADRGYDVWMGNARGNYYSRYHIEWDADIDKKQFWNFSWHEIGKIDLPTMIDFILEKSQVEHIYYVGHSQGTTSFFVMMSERPEYNDKIRVMVALAPVAFQEHLPNRALKIIAKFNKILSWVVNMLGPYEFLPSTTFMKLIGQALCNYESNLKGICSNVLFLIAGYDEPQLNKTMLPVIISNTPAGSSTKQFVHYAQMYTSKEFQHYDYGRKKNEEIYGPGFKQPPIYDLKKVTAPVALFYGQNDLITDERDIIRLQETLPHAIRTSKIKYPLFSHLDFLWSIDVVKLIYNDVFDVLERY